MIIVKIEEIVGSNNSKLTFENLGKSTAAERDVLISMMEGLNIAENSHSETETNSASEYEDD